MHSHTQHTWKRHTLWLSLLLHLLMLLGMGVVLMTARDPLPSTSPQAIQSYLAPAPEQAPSQPAEASQQSAMTPVEAPPVEKKSEPKQVAKDGIEKPIAAPVKQVKEASKPAPSRKPHKPVFARDAIPEDVSNPIDEEPLHLIGESKIIQPLIKILARALSRHLFYPRVAAELSLRGTVLVGFVLHPAGYVTEAKVVKSSGAGVLDDAARDAVGSMSPVGDVHEFVSAPEYLVVGIIFG
jgi:periplasmic protein TonB